MKITKKTSPQGVEIEYVEYAPAASAHQLAHLSTMAKLDRERRCRRDERAKRKDGAK